MAIAFVMACRALSAAPNIYVYAGGGTAIRDGQTSVAYENLTSYGAIAFTGSVSKTHSFVILNNGNSALTLDALPVTITGADASHYSVSTPPNLSIAANGYSSFGIKFDPTSAGFKLATVNIHSNDPDSPTFNFNVYGAGNDNASLLGPNLYVGDVTILGSKIKAKSGQPQLKFNGTARVYNSGQLPSMPGECFLSVHGSDGNPIGFDDGDFLDSGDAQALKPKRLKPVAPGESRDIRFRFTLPRVPTEEIIFQVQVPDGGDTAYQNNLLHKTVP